MKFTGKQGGALAAIALAIGVVAYVAMGGIEKNLVYYLTPDELTQKGAAARNTTVRLGGLVQTGSVAWDAKTLALRFRVGMMPTGDGIAVAATGAPPQMFQEGSGAVVEGSYDGQLFHAQRVLAKHSNEYRPPPPGKKPQDVYSTLQPAE